MRKKQPSIKGTALIITLGVLMLISVTGILFTNLAQLERKASANFTNTLYARFTAIAGIERATKALCNTAMNSGFDTLQNSIIFPEEDIVTRENIAGLSPTDNPGFPISTPANIRYWSYPDTGAPVPCSGSVGGFDPSNIPTIGNYEQYGNTYTLKILDCASQININMRSQSLSRILRNLGQRLQYWGGTSGGNHYILTKIPGIKEGADSAANPLIDADNILNIRDTMYNGRFNSKEDLISIIGPRNYNIVKDFVTTSSWVDPNSVSSGGPPTNPENIPVYGRQLRSPVNINTASKPVLEALIMGLSANVPLFDVDQSTHTFSDTGLGFIEDTSIDYRQDFALVTGFTATVAENIATKIIQYRWNNPFSSWEGFYNFLENQLINTDLPALAFKPTWVTDDVWYQLCKDVLKANFNPNVRETRFNFNNTVKCLVSKGDLWSRPPNSQPGYSTEFCFSSMGRFEITSYSQITANSIVAARGEVRACIQAYDFRRHTSQKDFEGDSVLRADFSNTISYPENMEDIVRAGGNIDLYSNDWCGWIEPKTVDGSAFNTGSPRLPVGYMGNLIFRDDFNPATTGLDAEVGGTGSTEANPATLEEINRIGATYVNIREDHRIRDANDGGGGVSVIPMTGGLFTNDEPGSDLMADGVFSHYLRNRYMAFRASPDPPVSGALTPGLVRGLNYDPIFNLPYYRGALEFWCKLDIDSGDSVPCGILGATQCLDDDPDSPSLPRDAGAKEGVQMFIWKSTLNELRISRVYYGIHFTDGADSIGLSLSNYGDIQRFLSPTDTDAIPRFRYSRREVSVPLSPRWRAHEWHNVVVSWVDAPDTTARLGIDCWIDGTPKTLDDGDSDPPPPLYNVGKSAHELQATWPIYMPHFAVGNARMPKDSLYLGGFVRFQARGDGVFKFVTYAFMPLNGTIDSVRIYREPPYASPYRLPSPNDIVTQLPRYRGDSQYTNSILMNVPAGRKLGCVYWNMHHPKGVREITYGVTPAPTVSLAAQFGVGTAMPGGGWSAYQENPQSIDLSSSITTGSANERLFYRVNFTGPNNNNFATDYLVPSIFEDITVNFEGSRLLEWEE